jgi:transposase InsO family protein
MAQELGNVRAACRAMGIHPSTYYRWKPQLDRHGPEILRPRERRTPRMANATSVLVEQRVVAFALGHPASGRPGSRLSWPSLAGVASSCRPEQHLQVDDPGELVQLDCFCIGRLSGTKGTVWQYSAIDVASAYTWATLQVTRRNPSAVWTSALARTVAADLASRGWRLERVMSDNASEFRSATFQAAIATLGARHTFIRAGRPQTNGCVERVQQTILDECWKPAFPAT